MTKYSFIGSFHTIIVSQADGRPPCVNGDNAIQWEWAKFNPSQNPNPLTDYDKTLHNWLCPRDEHVTPKLCQSTVRERLGKYVKYKAFFLFILMYFFPDSPTEVTRGRISTHDGSNYAQSRKEMPFGDQHDGRQHLQGKISKNRQKGAFLGVFSVCEQNEDEWPHRRITSLASA